MFPSLQGPEHGYISLSGTNKRWTHKAAAKQTGLSSEAEVSTLKISPIDKGLQMGRQTIGNSEEQKVKTH